jgi:4-amino-4-deoxy-L-arabinose transferase-like glycosyltransferase
MTPTVATRARLRIRTVQTLQGLMMLAALVYLILYLYVAVSRINYPYELEWMEGGTVDQVARLMAGQPMYVQPSIDFVPAIYTPLYYYVSALVSRITGIGFLPLRLVSFAASLGIFVLLYMFGKKATGSRRYGVLAAGLFAASYHLCGAWFDIARVDSLFVCLLLWSVYQLRFAQNTRDLLLTSGGLWLAFLTKQTTLIIAAPLLLYSIYAFRRRSLVVILPFVGLTLLSIWVLDIVHDGWFTYYVFDIPSRHRIDPTQYLGFWTKTILANVPILFLLSITGVVMLLRRLAERPAFFTAMLMIGCLASSWTSMLHSGGYVNVLMPSLIALVLASIELFGDTVQIAATDTGRVRSPWYMVVVTLLLLQLGWLWYDPARQIPSQAARDAGTEIISVLRGAEGDVYMPYHPYLPALAGKRTYAHQMALKDVARADGVMGRKLSQELADLYNSRRFGLVVLDYPSSSPALEQNYVLSSQLFPNVSAYQPVTGWPTYPRYWYVPRQIR